MAQLKLTDLESQMTEFPLGPESPMSQSDCNDACDGNAIIYFSENIHSACSCGSIFTVFGLAIMA